MQGDPVVGGVGDGHERLERRVHHRLRVENMLENVIRRGESRFGIAAQQMIIERDIGIAPTLQMLQIRKSGGWLQFRMNEHRGGRRLAFVVD